LHNIGIGYECGDTTCPPPEKQISTAIIPAV